MINLSPGKIPATGRLFLDKKQTERYFMVVYF